MNLTAVINPVVPLNLLFPHQRVICPHSRQSAKYRIVTHNFTNDDLTDGNSLSYQYIYIYRPYMVHNWELTSLGDNPVQPSWWIPVVVSILYVIYNIYNNVHLNDQFCNRTVKTVSHGNNCYYNLLALMLGLELHQPL